MRLEIYSPWSPGSVDDHYLRELISQFRADHGYVANIRVTHSLRAAQIGLTSGDPPDALYTNPGRELYTRWVVAGQMEPLDDVYDHYGLRQALPSGLIDLVSFDDQVWSLPLSVSRSNVLWYNRQVFAANAIQPADLQTFEGWEAAAMKLQAAGITPLAFGSTEPWVIWQLFESILVGSAGPDKYLGLWNGTTDWRGPEVRLALQNLQMMLRYTNPDHSRTEWSQAYRRVIDEQAAMFVMGDWMVREFSNSGFGSYGHTTPPGTAGTFVVWLDAFSQPSGTSHPQVAKEFLAFLGSKPAQEFFNRSRGSGSVCPRLDCDYSGFGIHSRTSLADYETDRLVPSVARAMASSEDWTADFASALQNFLRERNIALAQSELDSACRAAKICE